VLHLRDNRRGLCYPVLWLGRFDNLGEPHHGLFVTHLRVPHELLVRRMLQRAARAQSFDGATSNQIFLPNRLAKVLIVQVDGDAALLLVIFFVLDH